MWSSKLETNISDWLCTLNTNFLYILVTHLHTSHIYKSTDNTNYRKSYHMSTHMKKVSLHFKSVTGGCFYYIKFENHEKWLYHICVFHWLLFYLCFLIQCLFLLWCYILKIKKMKNFSRKFSKSRDSGISISSNNNVIIDDGR